MEYIINVENAQDFKDEIIYRITEQEDKDGSAILTWGIESAGDDTVIVHTKDQWEEKGCIQILVNKQNNKLKFEFNYWQNYPDEDCNEVDERYILGRATELLLSHFYGEFGSININ